jgi:hypothetical protein
MGRLPETWVAPPAVRELRDEVRYRNKLTRLRSGLKAQVHQVRGKEGLIPATKGIWWSGGQRWLDELQLTDAYLNRIVESSSGTGVIASAVPVASHGEAPSTKRLTSRATVTSQPWAATEIGALTTTSLTFRPHAAERLGWVECIERKQLHERKSAQPTTRAKDMASNHVPA